MYMLIIYRKICTEKNEWFMKGVQTRMSLLRFLGTMGMSGGTLGRSVAGQGEVVLGELA